MRLLLSLVFSNFFTIITNLNFYFAFSSLLFSVSECLCVCTESIRCYFFTIFCVKQKRFDFLLKIVLISRFNSINLLALLILYRLNATYWYLRSVYLSECVLVFVLLYLISEHWGNHRYIVSRKICFWGYWKLLFFIIITIILEINYNKRLWWRLVGWSGSHATRLGDDDSFTHLTQFNAILRDLLI